MTRRARRGIRPGTRAISLDNPTEEEIRKLLAPKLPPNAALIPEEEILIATRFEFGDYEPPQLRFFLDCADCAETHLKEIDQRRYESSREILHIAHMDDGKSYIKLKKREKHPCPLRSEEVYWYADLAEIRRNLD